MDGEKMGENQYTCKHERKDGMATKSDKIHFRARKHQRQRVALHNNKSISSLRSHNNPVYIQNNTSSKYVKQKFREPKKINKPANKWGISTSPLSHHHTENKHGYKRTEQYYRPMESS